MWPLACQDDVTDALLTHGEAELFKGGVHLCLFGLTAMCFGYNLMALSQRHERHLAANVAIYGALSWFEFRQIIRHLEHYKE